MFYSLRKIYICAYFVINSYGSITIYFPFRSDFVKLFNDSCVFVKINIPLAVFKALEKKVGYNRFDPKSKYFKFDLPWHPVTPVEFNTRIHGTEDSLLYKT